MPICLGEEIGVYQSLNSISRYDYLGDLMPEGCDDDEETEEEKKRRWSASYQ